MICRRVKPGGFASSLPGSMDPDLESPDHTTLSRRAEHLETGLPAAGKGGAIQTVVASTGLQIVGQVPWAHAKNGRRGTREWRKLNVGVDENGVIVAKDPTDSTADDTSVVPALVRQIPDDTKITRCTADGAYDRIVA